MTEYNNNTSSGASCSYAALGNYTADYSLNIAPQGKQINGAYIVPTWSPISYDALTSSVPSCSGYADINQAYGKNAGTCQTTYRTSLCGNNTDYGSDCGSLNPNLRTACCSEKQMKKVCDKSCANTKQYCN